MGRRCPRWYKELINLCIEKEEDTSPEGKLLPLGFTKFNARNSKYVHIPVLKRGEFDTIL